MTSPSSFEFDTQGFLTERRGELETQIAVAFRPIFDPALKLNQECHALIFGADIRNRDPQALLIATLFLRSLEHYQATLILLGTGLVAPAKATLRSLIETVFLIRAIASAPDAWRNYVESDLIHQKRMINRARNQSHPSLANLREELTAELSKQLDEQIQAKGVKEIKVEELSRRAGMHDWDVTTYSMLSRAVHTQVREADRYLGFDTAGAVRELVYGPSMPEIPLLVLTAADCLLVAAEAVDRHFQSRLATKLNDCRTALKAGWDGLQQTSDGQPAPI